MHMLNKASCLEEVWCSGITAQLILNLSTGWSQVVSFKLIAAFFPPKEKKVLVLSLTEHWLGSKAVFSGAEKWKYLSSF
jgi:hypothetical protein